MTDPNRLLTGSLDAEVQCWLKAGVDWRPAAGEQERIWQSIANEAGKAAVAITVAQGVHDSAQVVATASQSAAAELVGAGTAKLTLGVVALKAVGVGLGIGLGLWFGGTAVKSHIVDRPAAIATSHAPTPVPIPARSVSKPEAESRTGGGTSRPLEPDDITPHAGSIGSVRATTVEAVPPAALTVTSPAVRHVAPTATTNASSTGPSMQNVAPPSNRDVVREESRLVSMVRIALRQGHTASAIEILSELDQHYPSGLLVEERSVLRIEAMVQNGQTGEASRQAERFLARYPSSLSVDRVRKLVGGSRPNQD